MAFRIIEYCIKSSYLPRKDLLSCQDSRGKNIVWETFNQKEVPGNELKNVIEKEIGYQQGKWKARENNESKKYVIFNDSVHKSIELNSLEVAIVDTKQFSRLRNIKQLGGVSYVYPGAVHTRFEHSIGVCHLARVFVSKLREKLERYKDAKTTIEDEEEKCIRIAALCHDLGHGPFSHKFEEFRKKILRETKKEIIEHEKISILIFKHILSTNMKVLSEFVAAGLSWEDVWKIEFMINPDMNGIRSEKKFLYEIVANKSSGLDVDKWDYYARDCHYLGISYDYDHGRTMELSSIVSVGNEYHIGFKRKEVENIYRMFRTRTVLYKKACAHKVVDAVQLMIIDVLEDAKDAQLFPHLKKPTLEKILDDFTDAPLTHLRGIDDYLELTDHIVTLIKMADADKHNIKKAHDILKKLETRELYKCGKEVVFPSSTYEKKEFNDPKQWSKDKITKICAAKLTDELQNQVSKISYASESTASNPVENIYFFEDDEGCLPRGVQFYNQKMRTRSRAKREPVSQINEPCTFTEYWVRCYGRTKRPRSEDAKTFIHDKLIEAWEPASKRQRTN